VWNPNAASDPTYQKWQSITLSSIPDGAVTNSKIAPLAVSDDKISAVAYGKISGLPPTFPPAERQVVILQDFILIQQY